MVGVPGRSKGCVTCRRRKVKCDEGKPHCLRCINTNRACEGYERKLLFVDEAPRQRAKIKALEQKKNASQSTHASPGELSFHTQPTIQPWLEDLAMSYLLSTLFRSRTKENFPHRHTWIASTETLDPKNVSHTAVQSLANAYFARMHGNEQVLMAKSARGYGKAIRMLATQLADGPNSCYENGNFLATMALHLYELIVGTDKGGWIHHARGMARLMEIRGPHRFREYPEHGYFLYCRSRIINEALATYKRTFLEQEIWQTVPFELHPETKTPTQVVLDITARIPGYYDDIENVKKMTSSRGSEAILAGFQEIQGKVLKEWIALIRWRWDWERNNPSSVVEMTDEHSSPMLHDIPRPDSLKKIYYYMDSTSAHEMSRWLMAMICIAGLTRRLRSSFLWKAALASLSASEIPLVTNPLYFPDENMDVFDLTREVCRSVDYFMLDGGLEVDTFCIMAALRTSLIALGVVPGADPRELAWVSTTLRRIGEVCRIDFGVHSSQLPWQKWPSPSPEPPSHSPNLSTPRSYAASAPSPGPPVVNEQEISISTKLKSMMMVYPAAPSPAVLSVETLVEGEEELP